MDDGFRRFVEGFSPGDPQPLNIETETDVGVPQGCILGLLLFI